MGWFDCVLLGLAIGILVNQWTARREAAEDRRNTSAALIETATQMRSEQAEHERQVLRSLRCSSNGVAEDISILAHRVELLEDRVFDEDPAIWKTGGAGLPIIRNIEAGGKQ